jgi:hypothetical protein
MHDGGGPDRERSLGWWRTRNIITKVDKLRLFVRKVEGRARWCTQRRRKGMADT